MYLFQNPLYLSSFLTRKKNPIILHVLSFPYAQVIGTNLLTSDKPRKEELVTDLSR